MMTTSPTTSSSPNCGARPLVALAGGKSGGHVFPALAVAEELESLGADVVLFGRPKSMEARLAGERALAFQAIGAAPLVGQGVVSKVAALITLAINAWHARTLLKAKGAVAVLGTGGFVSAPTVLGARLAGLPIVLLEPNAHPGAANQLLSRFARLAAVAFEETGKRMRCPALVTGVPVRSAFFSVDALTAEPQELQLLVVGGSQGAARLNQRLPGALARELRSSSVVHQCGSDHLESAVEAWVKALGEGSLQEQSETEAVLEGKGLKVQIVPFIDDMPGALASAHLVVSRAGAITLAEIAAAGRASILVPLPIAGAHQLANAQRQAALGAALVVEQDALDGLGVVLRQLVEEPGELVRMGEAAHGAARPNAARTIAEATRDVAVHAGRWAA